MDFKEALNKICQDFNKEIIFERRVISILDDYGAFKDVPYYKLFYKTIILSGDLRKLVGGNKNDCNKEFFSFVSKTGLDENKVKSFLASIFECYTGKNIELRGNINSAPNTVSHKSNKTGNKSPLPDNLQNTQSNRIKFMGVPIGAKYLEFENALFKRGASVYRNNKQEVTFLLKDYLFERDAHITLSQSSYPYIVSKITIEIQTGLTVKEFRENFTNKVLNLYKRKYGDHYKKLPLRNTIYEWNLTDTEISIYNVPRKTVIVYSLITDEFRKNKKAKLDELRKFQETERIKKEQEELKRKKEKEAKLLRAKRLFDDI